MVRVGIVANCNPWIFCNFGSYSSTLYVLLYHFTILFSFNRSIIFALTHITSSFPLATQRVKNRYLPSGENVGEPCSIVLLVEIIPGAKTTSVAPGGV